MSQKKSVDFTKDDYGNWLFKTEGAKAAEVTFAIVPYATANGVIGYWDNVASEWKTIDWSGESDENGKITAYFEIPAGIEQMQVQVYYSAYWDNALGAMVNTEAELVNVTLFFDVEQTVVTTTNAPVTTPVEVITTTNAPVTTTNAPVTTPVEVITTTNAPITTLVVTTTTPVATTTTPNTEVTLIGDATCDGVVNVGDVVAILQHVANPAQMGLSAQGQSNADVEQRGNGINSNDAVAIKEWYIGLRATL